MFETLTYQEIHESMQKQSLYKHSLETIYIYLHRYTLKKNVENENIGELNSSEDQELL